MEIYQKILTLHTSQPAFQGHQGHWNRHDRSATYDFLLVFHSNYGLISYRFRDLKKKKFIYATLNIQD